MRHARHLMVGILVIAAVLVLSAPLSWAGHFRTKTPNASEPSAHHTSWGVSQLLAGNYTNADNQTSIKLYNPNHVVHIAAVLIYGSDNEVFAIDGSNNNTSAEVWLDCEVRRLTPHGAYHVATPNNSQILNYVEVPNVPENPVTVGAGSLRICDGCGIGGANNIQAIIDNNFRLVDPDMFSPASNAVVPGQQAAQKACVCAGLEALSFQATPPGPSPLTKAQLRNIFGAATAPGHPFNALGNCP